MKKKILAFGASNSKQSINKELAGHAVRQIEEAEVNLVDLNDYEMPIYSIDKEQETGIPHLALKFKKLINDADGIIISFAEHNGSYSAAFKNIIDWVSRIERSLWGHKPMLLLATSPGPRGGLGVLGQATGGFPHMGAKSLASFSLPSFIQNYSVKDGIVNTELNRKFQEQLSLFKSDL